MTSFTTRKTTTARRQVRGPGYEGRGTRAGVRGPGYEGRGTRAGYEGRVRGYEGNNAEVQGYWCRGMRGKSVFVSGYNGVSEGVCSFYLYLG